MEATQFDVDKLEAMKRTELQKLCKSVGIKANSKTAQLIEALKEYAKQFPGKPDSQGSTNGTDQEKINLIKMDVEETAETTTTPPPKTEDTYKKQLLQQLEKSVTEKMPIECKIPRFVQFVGKDASVAGSNKESSKWNNIHKSQFEKMDSIDVYLEKKRKRMESFNQSVKRAKTAIDAGKSNEANPASASKKTPARKSLGVTRKSQGKTAEKIPKPSTTKSTTFKFVFGSPMARPVFQSANRKSKVSIAPLPPSQKKLKEKPQTPGNPPRKSLATTPFRFLPANVPKTPVPTPKKTFDLKASLAKPLSYKPHTGKLKQPCDYKEEFKPTLTESKLKNRKVDVKTAKVTTREARRLKSVNNRENRRANAMSKRRGLAH